MCLVKARELPAGEYVCYKIVKRSVSKSDGHVRYAALVMKNEIPPDVISGRKPYIAERKKEVESLRSGTKVVIGGFIHSYADRDVTLHILDMYKWRCYNADDTDEETRLEAWECRIKPLEGGLPYIYFGEIPYEQYASEALRFVRRLAWSADGETTLAEDLGTDGNESIGLSPAGVLT